MNRVVTLKFVNGSLERGFSVILQIANEGERASFQTIAQLPPAPEIPRFYHQWQTIYRFLGKPIRRVATTHRIELMPEEEATHISSEDCDRIAEQLSKRMNSWLRSESFRAVREGLLENLKRNDAIRLLLQTEDVQLKRLPWHLWDFFDRYPKAEIALSLSKYKRSHPAASTSPKVKILAVLGNSSGINIEADRILLGKLPNAKVRFCVKPKRQHINDRLWDEGWDVLFFAGHSSSHANGETGQIQINDKESISLNRLKYGLSRAVKNGLKLAIFNSCDGLGLAKELAQLQIPQIIVMREPVPDMVAQAFLKSFLKAFSRGVPFYLAVREARERLQGLEDRFPCATWLPIICQHPAERPPTWASLGAGLEGSSTHIASAEDSDLGTTQVLDNTHISGDIGIDVVKIRIPVQPAKTPKTTQKTTKTNKTTRSAPPRRKPSSYRSSTTQRRPKSSKPSSIAQVKQAANGVATAAGKLYAFVSWVQQVSIEILQLMVFAGIGSGLGAALGFFLTYHSPFSKGIKMLLSRSGFSLPLGITLDLEPSLLVFLFAGLGVAWGLSKVTHLEREPAVFAPMGIAAVGYGVAWCVWQFDSADTTAATISHFGAIAVLFLILGMRFTEHPVMHTLIGFFGTAIVLPWFVGGSDYQTFTRLMLVSQSAPVSSKALLMVAHIKPLFWQSIQFFTILGSIASFWLGVSYYLVLPRLSWR